MAAQPGSSAKYVLGIDLGTSSIKVVLFDTRSKTVTHSCRLPTDSDVIDDTQENVGSDGFWFVLGFFSFLFQNNTWHESDILFTIN